MTGTMKKMNFPILKAIKINEEQNNNWNPKLIRNALDSNRVDIKELLQKLYDMMRIKMKVRFDLNDQEMESLMKIEEVLNV